MDCINNKIEEALKDKNIVKIMNKASRRFINQLDKDSIYSCQLNALWRSFVNFKPDKNTKFTTYLYNGVFIECLKELKFQNKLSKYASPLHSNIASKKSDNIIIEIMDELKTDEEKSLIQDRLSNMTIAEIAKKHNSNRETIRKRIKKLINKIHRNFS